MPPDRFTASKIERQDHQEPHLVLGSTSVHKQEALSAACARLGLKTTELTQHPAESEINAQPYGFEETHKGALNRAKNTQTQYPTSIAIGIENGLIPVNDTYIDLAVVVVLLPHGELFSGTSAGIDFPKEAVEEARRRGFEHTTAGDIFAETTGASKTDPHSILTGGALSRKELLTEAVTATLSRALTNR